VVASEIPFIYARMVIRFEPLQKRLRRLDGVRRRAYVARVRRKYTAWTNGRIPLAWLCRDAGEALHDYASEATHAYLAGVTASRGSEAPAWALDAYHEGLSRAGVAMREAVADAGARHAVAQALQEQMLHAELHVHQLLRAASIVERQA
jgi:hypothetical protein